MLPKFELNRDVDANTEGWVHLAFNRVGAYVSGKLGKVLNYNMNALNGISSVQHYGPLADMASVHDSTTASGGTVTTQIGNSTYIYEPAAGVAALTVVLPPNPDDGTNFNFVSTQAVTALTVNAGTGGASLGGAPTAMTANTSWSMQYSAATNKWYRRY